MKIPKRIASVIINSLKGGVVPRIGLPYITVGRENEIDAFLNDIEIIGEGGAAFRFIVGKYGSGKSFLLQTVRSYAMDKNMVVADADLSPERRLQGTRGQGLATYKELIRNMSTKTRPEGGALTLILDRWISGLQTEVMNENSLGIDDDRIPALTERKISEVISSLNEMVHGFDFARLLTVYYKAYLNGDDDWYEYIKLFALFLKKAGYSGLLILIDELVNIYKIPNSITRQYNYEKILTMYNDTMQGKAQYMGIIMSGTPQCIEDTRRGVYSYEALKSRLTEGRFGKGELRDMSAPVIKLAPLTYEELLVLIEKLTEIHAVLYEYTPDVTENDMIEFIKLEFSRIGADSAITPREVIRDYIELLNIIHQNPGTDIKSLMSSDGFSFAKPEPQGEVAAEFAEFEL